MDIPPCVIVHHGGKWVQNPEFSYVGGQVKIFNDLPWDFNGKKLKDLISSLGYMNIIKLHYCDPLRKLENGVRFLDYDDTTLTTFINMLQKYKMIDLFIEHSDDEIGVVTNFERNNVAYNNELQSVCLDGTNANVNMCEEVDYDEEIELFESVTKLAEEVDYDEEGSDNEDCEVIDARQRLKEAAITELEYMKELQSLDRVAHRSGDNNIGSCSEYEDDSSDLDSPPNSDAEEDDCGYLLPPPKKIKKSRLSAKANKLQLGSFELKSPFFIGQQFEDAVEFRKAITNYCVSIGRDVDYKRNDKGRIGAACKAKDKGCPWYIWASLERGERVIHGKDSHPKS
ncbi:Cortactin-binding protein 2 [Bienertia sinuspersici]